MSTSSPYCTYTYHIKRDAPIGVATPIDYSSKLTQSDMSSLLELKAKGWTKDQPPVSRFFITGDHPYIGVDIPQQLWEHYKKQLTQIKSEPNPIVKANLQSDLQDKMQEWANATLKVHMTTEAINNLVIKSIAAFETTLVKLEKASYNTPSGMIGFYVGDSHQSAHFQTGAGAVTGVKEAREFAKLIIKETHQQNKGIIETVEAYNNVLEELAYILHKRAFDFPTGEDLKVKPTKEFRDLEARIHPENKLIRDGKEKEIQRLVDIQQGRGVAKNSAEAQVKAKGRRGRF